MCLSGTEVLLQQNPDNNGLSFSHYYCFCNDKSLKIECSTASAGDKEFVKNSQGSSCKIGNDKPAVQQANNNCKYPESTANIGKDDSAANLAVLKSSCESSCKGKSASYADSKIFGRYTYCGCTTSDNAFCLKGDTDNLKKLIDSDIESCRNQTLTDSKISTALAKKSTKDPNVVIQGACKSACKKVKVDSFISAFSSSSKAAECICSKDNNHHLCATGTYEDEKFAFGTPSAEDLLCTTKYKDESPNGKLSASTACDANCKERGSSYSVVGSKESAKDDPTKALCACKSPTEYTCAVANKGAKFDSSTGNDLYCIHDGLFSESDRQALADKTKLASDKTSKSADSAGGTPFEKYDKAQQATNAVGSKTDEARVAGDALQVALNDPGIQSALNSSDPGIKKAAEQKIAKLQNDKDLAFARLDKATNDSNVLRDDAAIALADKGIANNAEIKKIEANPKATQDDLTRKAQLEGENTQIQTNLGRLDPQFAAKDTTDDSFRASKDAATEDRNKALPLQDAANSKLAKLEGTAGTNPNATNPNGSGGKEAGDGFMKVGPGGTGTDVADGGKGPGGKAINPHSPKAIQDGIERQTVSAGSDKCNRAVLMGIADGAVEALKKDRSARMTLPSFEVQREIAKRQMYFEKTRANPGTTPYKINDNDPEVDRRALAMPVSRNEVAEYVNDHPEIKSNAESKFACSASEDFLAAMEASNIGLQVTVQTTAGVLSGVAIGKSQASLEAGNDATKVNQDSINAMADAVQNTGYTQAGAGTAQMGIAITTYIKRKKYESNQNELMALQNKQSGVVDDTITNYKDKLLEKKTIHRLSTAGLGIALERQEESEASKDNTDGTAAINAAVDAQKLLVQKAKAIELAATMNSIQNAAAAAQNISLAEALRRQVVGASGAQVLPDPLTAGTPGEQAPDAVAPPSFGSPTGGGFAENAVAEQVNPDEGAAGNGPIAPPLFGGGGNSGGLRDGAPPGGSAGQLGVGKTDGGGGGGLSPGGGGGGAAGAGAGEERGGPTSLVQGGVSKFEGQGSAAAFAAAGGGAKPGDTGAMDLNGLLAQFMPKKDEDGRGPAGDIMNAKKADGTVGPGDRDDGSILGKNANLFLRVSNTTMSYYKRGNLR